MRYPAQRLCAAPVLPLARHPYINNRIIALDLEGDIDGLLALPAEALAARLYTRAADLAEGEQRVPLKEVHLNKVPALVAWNHLRPADHARLGIDVATVEAAAQRVRAAGPALIEKVRQVYAGEREATVSDVDAALYDGFLADGDKALMTRLRTSPPSALADYTARLRDPRMPELLFRYRARNHPDTLDAAERQRWDGYRRQRLLGDAGLGEQTLPQYRAQLAALATEHAADPARLALLQQLADWGTHLEQRL
jgi:exodeoxyribonuclease I